MYKLLNILFITISFPAVAYDYNSNNRYEQQQRNNRYEFCISNCNTNAQWACVGVPTNTQNECERRKRDEYNFCVKRCANGGY